MAWPFFLLGTLLAGGPARPDLSERILSYRVPSERNFLREEHLYTTSGTVSVGYGLERFRITRIVNGLFGVTVDGASLTVKPIDHPSVAGMALRGLTVRATTVDIIIAGDGGTYEVRRDGSPPAGARLGEPGTRELPPLRDTW